MASVKKALQDQKRPRSVGSRQAVETAIDASKMAENQTWEQAAQRSINVPPWSSGQCKKPDDDRK
jgi:hypothetical protein